MLDDLRELRQLLRKRKGGPGSGHFGHAGRPGQRGGSVPGTGVAAARTASWSDKPELLGQKPDTAAGLINPSRLSVGVIIPGGSGVKSRAPTTEQLSRVESELRKLPVLHQGLVDSVHVMNAERIRSKDGTSIGVKKAFQYSGYDKTYTSMEGAAVHTRQSRDIYLAGRNEYGLDRVVSHEVAHMVLPSARDIARGRSGISGDAAFNRRRKIASSKLKDNYNRLKNVPPFGEEPGAYKGEFVTYYSKRSTLEYMAECYGHYVARPTVLKAKDPMGYDIIKDLFEGQEYM